jgi:hypothetical protein
MVELAQRRPKLRYNSAMVTITAGTLRIDLTDGRTIAVPLAWYPRLQHGRAEERQHWRPIGAGEGLHWPGLDEDISIENLLAGQPSGESQASLRRWLDGRTTNAVSE